MASVAVAFVVRVVVFVGGGGGGRLVVVRCAVVSVIVLPVHMPV
jgi:hypothetical protein